MPNVFWPDGRMQVPYVCAAYLQMFLYNMGTNLKSSGKVTHEVQGLLENVINITRRWTIKNGDSFVGFLTVGKETEGEK